jgi:chromosome segregation ATPase
MDLRQQYAMSVININTAKARLEDLRGQIAMANQ